ncbi:MAG: hypothetical protein JNM42_02815 [Propionivibrio sp.]|nr:hypothetical protein [Propionivibrio sp.]
MLYLGEINDAQRAAWCKTIDVLEGSGCDTRQIAIFPEDRPAPELDCAVVQVRLDPLRLERPWQWGSSWLAREFWSGLQLDEDLGVAQPDTRYLCMDKRVARNSGLQSAELLWRTEFDPALGLRLCLLLADQSAYPFRGITLRQPLHLTGADTLPVRCFLPADLASFQKIQYLGTFHFLLTHALVHLENIHRQF